MEKNKPNLVKIFKLVLPKLTEGWLRQRGEVFCFGDFDQENPKLLPNIDPDNNMAAERQVGSINYELKKMIQRTESYFFVKRESSKLGPRQAGFIYLY